MLADADPQERSLSDHAGVDTEWSERGPRRACALTEREAEILQRTEAGQSLRQIATDLHPSYTSVQTRLENARRRGRGLRAPRPETEDSSTYAGPHVAESHG